MLLHHSWVELSRAEFSSDMHSCGAASLLFWANMIRFIQTILWNTHESACSSLRSLIPQYRQDLARSPKDVSGSVVKLAQSMLTGLLDYVSWLLHLLHQHPSTGVRDGYDPGLGSNSWRAICSQIYCRCLGFFCFSVKWPLVWNGTIQNTVDLLFL